jgi:hypothetical protein
VQGEPWNRAVLFRGPGGSEVPPAILTFAFDLDFEFGWWSGVEVFLTTLSCSLRRCGQEQRNETEPPVPAGSGNASGLGGGHSPYGRYY